jgi:hypothetical protein
MAAESPLSDVARSMVTEELCRLVREARGGIEATRRAQHPQSILPPPPTLTHPPAKKKSRKKTRK